ncbi:MAG TPA: preprotein translocase subunit SecE [Candidatus Paceibacterota bacterium]
MSRFTQYLQDTRVELKHVSWPTRRQAIVFTTLVILVSLATAFLLGFFDFIFTLLIEKFII